MTSSSITKASLKARACRLVGNAVVLRLDLCNRSILEHAIGVVENLVEVWIDEVEFGSRPFSFHNFRHDPVGQPAPEQGGAVGLGEVGIAGRKVTSHPLADPSGS